MTLIKKNKNVCFLNEYVEGHPIFYYHWALLHFAFIDTPTFLSQPSMQLFLAIFGVLFEFKCFHSGIFLCTFKFCYRLNWVSKL